MLDLTGLDAIDARLRTSYWPARATEPLVEQAVGDLLREAAREAPDELALVAVSTVGTDRRQWTYAELLSGAEQLGRSLATRFAPGERVALWAPNIPEWVFLEFGLALAGLTLVTVNPAFRAPEVSYVLRQSRASGVLFVDEFRGNPMGKIIEEIRGDLPDLREAIDLAGWDELLADGAGDAPLPEVTPDDPAQIQYTSGTTGFPKGAMLSHRSIVNNARLTALRGGFVKRGVMVSPCPMFHTGGCVLSALGAVSVCATQVLTPIFDPGLTLRLIEQERATTLITVPTMFIAMLGHPDIEHRDLSSVDDVMIGAATVPAELVRQIERRLGCAVTVSYGQTELAPIVTMAQRSDTAEDKANTVGQPLPHVEVKIADPVTGETVPPGVSGEICARGYQAMLGYFDKPVETRETLDEEGWVHTGDLGAMDERGYVRITGRLKEMIIRGGENIYPREMEDLLFAHPGVAEAAVIGIPDPVYGEQVAAVIRPADPADPPSEQELHSYCREHLAPHKTPREWYLIDELPLTGSGKIRKFVLRDAVVERRLARLG